MNEFKALLGLELRSVFGINKFIYTKDKKEKKRYISLLCAWAFIILVASFYVGLLTVGYTGLGLASVVPSYLVVIASLLIMAFGIFKAGNIIFACGGYDLFAAMPIKTEGMVTARFVAMYIEDLAVALVIMVPGISVVGFLTRPGILFYIFAVIGALFVPMIPLVISTLFGTLIMALTSRMKHKNIMQTVLMVGFIVATLLLSFSSGTLEDVTPEQMESFAELMNGLIRKLYFPAILFGEAVNGTAPLGILWFLLMSLISLAACILLAARLFHPIIRAVSRVSAKHDYKAGTLKSSGALKALYKKEAKRYFSSSIYVTNTIVGPIMALIMSVAVLVAGKDSFGFAFPLPLDHLFPFLLSGVLTMMTTPCVSISMEGKHFWLVKSMPVSSKILFDSKILWGITLISPFYLVSAILLTVALRPTPFDILFLFLIPALQIILVSVLGITVNLKFHSFDWDREEKVVKQSSAAFFGGFSGFLISLAFIIVTLLVPTEYSQIVKLAACALFAALAPLCYIYNNKARLEEL